MALEFAHGDIAWNSADAVNTDYTVSGLSFRPKAFLFFINGQANSTDASTETTTARWCIGFASGTADRRCMGFIDVDGAGSQDTAEIYRDDAVVATVTGAGVVDGLLDLQTVNDDGFVLRVDDAAPVNLRVFWMAWGGDDIETAATGEIAEPAATGSQSVTVNGWKQNVGDTCIFFAGCQLTAAPPTAAAQDAGLLFGAMSHRDIYRGWRQVINCDENSATMDTDRYEDSGDTTQAPVIAMIPVGGSTSVDAAARILGPSLGTGFTSTGFNLDWTLRAVTNRRYMYLAIQGGSWFVGDEAAPTTVSATTTHTAGGFQPKGAVISHLGNNVTGHPNTTTEAQFGIGCFSSTSSRRAMGYYSENGTANAEVNLIVEYDEVLAFPSFVGGINWLVDIDAVLPGGFRLICDDAPDTGGNFFVKYVMFGDAPPVYIQPVQGVREIRKHSNQFMYRAARPRLHEDWFSAEAPAVEFDTFTQSILGTRSIAAAKRRYWTRVARQAEALGGPPFGLSTLGVGR